MNKKKEQNQAYPYKFAVNNMESLVFKCSGEKIKKAVLEADGVILSIIKVKQDGAQTELDFFGGKALHRALLPESSAVNVTLVTTSKNSYPSLSIGELGKSLTWDIIEDDKYIEDVVAGSEQGPKNLKLYYFKSGRCGYYG